MAISERGSRSAREPRNVPSQAQVIVVGAGVVGCSVAYHLTKLGCRDVLLLERRSVGCGTSWHSLGVVGLLRASPTLTRLAMDTARLLPELERETGKSTGFSVRGCVNVTGDPARLTQFRRVADIGRSLGLAAEEIDAAEAKRLWPLMDPAGLIGALHLPTEGQCNPLDLTQAYLAGARAGGAVICENVTVSDVHVRKGRVLAVETSAGRIACEQVVNCTGMWARDFGRAAGAQLPVQAVEHNYIVTEFLDDVSEGMPLMRDPDIRLTVREDARQLSVGFNEEIAKLFALEGVPEDFCFDQLPPDLEEAMPYLEQARQRVPILDEAGLKLFLCGPESVTPDTRYLLGPLPDLKNCFVAAGFSGFGIGSSGGAGRALAEWVITGYPQQDLWEVDVRRMMPFQSNRPYLANRAVEAQGRLFAVNWPHLQYESARGVRHSPLHSALQDAGACFGSVAGWETAEWFAPPGVEPRHHYSFEQPDWFPHARAEVEAAQGTAALFDRSSLGKFLIVGRAAKDALSQICAGNPEIAIGAQIRTPLLNEKGGIEALVTLLRRAPDEYLLLSAAATQVRDLALLRERLSGWEGVGTVDATSAFSVIEVIGPQAGATLARVGCATDRGSLLAAEIGSATAHLLPLEDLNVPAWSVVVPSEFACGLFQTFQEAGAPLGLALMGSHARHYVQTLSRSPVWSQALTADDTPLEAGLDGLIDLTSDRAYVGREACERQRAEGPERRLCAIELEGTAAVLLGDEPILRRGSSVGSVGQAAYALGNTAAIGLGYVACAPGTDPQALAGEGYEVLVAGRRVPARIETVGTPARAEGLARTAGLAAHS